jgi:hypothetical protein
VHSTGTDVPLPISVFDNEAALRKLAAYLREKDWLKKAYLYVVDEPITKEQYDLLRERAARVHAADPELKIVAGSVWANDRAVYPPYPAFLRVSAIKPISPKPASINA